MRSRLNRREFLKSTALAGAALSTCELNLAAPRAQTLRRGGPPKKVIVVGAGLAGLSAAYELTQAGHDVTLLEAQMRAGGRVLTLRKPFSDGLYAEAGAMLIPDTHNFTHDYVRLFDLPLDPYAPSNLKSVFYVRGKRIREDLWDASTSLAFRLTAEEKMLGLRGIWQKYAWPSSVFEEIGNPAAPDWPLQSLKKYDQMTYADFLRSQGASPEAVALLSVGRLWGNGLDRVSALAVLRDAVHLMNQKMGPFRIRGGNDLLPKAFAERLREKIRYGSPLVKIEHDARGVRAVFLQAGTPQSIAGDHLICAIPFSCLRRVEVSPRFSAEKQKAIEQLPYFSAARVSLQTRKRFWLEEGLNGFALTDLPMAEVVAWTSNQPGRRGILQGYLGGRHARRVTSMKEDERVRYTLALMEKVYPGTRENFESGISKCWDEDEWARGASSWYKPGQMSALWPHVATSEGRVHFAGDHTSAWIRWMQGALGSGIRAAREVDEAV